MELMSVRAIVLHWLCGLLSLSVMASTATAHEFWIEPTNYQVGEDSVLEAYLRNGEKFFGSSAAYVKAKTTRFDLVNGERTDSVVARLGDNPALKMQSLQPGLNVVVHQSNVSVLTYANWEKFQRFADHKDFPDMLARHRARSLPESQFKEAYTRYSKSLISVGSGEGNDVQAGLEIELLALQNPYTDDVSKGIVVVGYYQNKVRANAQIELYEKTADGEVQITLHRTDAQGKVVLPVRPSHSYLVDMVVLREPSDELARKKKVAWETLWASLTFAVP